MTFTIPDEIINYISTELKIKPETYILNECLKPLINKYKDKVTNDKLEEAQTNADTEILATKNKLKIKIVK